MATSSIIPLTAAEPTHPEWWGLRGVTNTSAPQNKGIANIGQLKHMANQAHAELQDLIPGGAGYPQPFSVPANPDALWYENQKKALNLGQLKAVAKPLYDRLNAISPAWVEQQMKSSGLTTLNTHYFKDTNGYFYPWNPTTPVSENYKPATVGQMKVVYCLRLRENTDNDSMLDIWERAVIAAHPEAGITDIIAFTDNGDLDGDMLTNLEEYSNGFDPFLADTDGDGLSDNFLIALAGRWELNGVSGSSVVLDSSGNEIDGDLMTGSRISSGAMAGAVSLGAQEQMKITPGPGQLNVGASGADFSVSFWIRRHANHEPGWNTILQKGDASSKRTFHVSLQPDGKKLHARLTSDTNVNEGIESSIADLVPLHWTHVSYVHGGGKLKLYVDGELDSTADVDQSIANDDPFYIGKSAWLRGINADFDQILIHRRILGESEVRQLAYMVDTDGDGIPDVVEYGIIARSNGTLQTLADITPQGDLDSDQVTNLVEYQSGTDMTDMDTDDDYVEDGPELQVSSQMALSNQINSSASVQGVYQALSRDPSGATVAIVLDSPVEVSSAKRLTNYSLNSFPVKSHSKGTVRYVDLDADGKMDLVTNGGDSRLYAYRNTGSREHPIYDTEPVDLVGRLKRYSGGTYSESSRIGSVDASFQDINGDMNDDLICGEFGDGQISYFLRTNAATVWPPQYAAQQITFYEDSIGNDRVIEVSSYIGGEDWGMGSPVLFDINGDGEDDLIVGDGLVKFDSFSVIYPITQSNGNIYVYLNTGTLRSDGTPVFAAKIDLQSDSGPIYVQDGIGFSFYGGIARPNFVDIDADGDDDLFVSDSEGRVWLFKNTGEKINDSNHSNNGFFRFEDGVLLRNNINEQIDFGSYAALDVADYDGDGDLDLIASGNALNGYEQGDLSVIRNIGDSVTAVYDDHYTHIGRKGIEAEFREGIRAKVSFWDLDDDGWKDMILGNSTGHILVSINTDTGNDAHTRFLEPLQLLDEAGSPLKVNYYSVPIPVDFGNDGTLDGLIVGAHTDVFFFEKSTVDDGTGIPRFINRGSVIEGLGVTGYRLFPAVTDLNGDGKLDIVVGNRDSGELFHMHNSTANAFTLAVAQKLQAGGVDIINASAPVLFDVDQDGDLDLLAGSKVATASWPITGDEIRFYKNDGTAQAPVFASGTVLSAGGNPISIGDDVSPNYLDYDGDGKLDLVAANNASQIRVYRNTTLASGSVSFADSIILSKAGVSPGTVEVANGQASGQQVIYVTFSTLAEPGTTVDINELVTLSGGQQVSFADQIIQLETDTDAGGAGDGLPDWWETILVNASTTDAINSLDDITLSADLDDDNNSNLAEYLAGTNALQFYNGDGFDSDNDGLPDGWEVYYGLDPNSSADAHVNTADGDWLTPFEEYNLGLAPNVDDDLDNDGWLDSETATVLNMDINDAYASPEDLLPWMDDDQDGISNAAEVTAGTNPLDVNDPAIVTYTPLVELKASDLTENTPVSFWQNHGSLEEGFTPGDQGPLVKTKNGELCVEFGAGTEDWLKGPTEPAWISGAGARTVAAWVYNPDVNISQSDVLVSWGGVASGSPEKSLFSVRYGNHSTQGALKLSGNGEGDQIWANNVAPVQGQWRFVVFRYNLQNRSLLVMQDFEAGILNNGVPVNTAMFNSTGGLQRLVVGGDSDTIGNITSQNTGLCIGRLYVYGESVPVSELLTLYHNHNTDYGRPDLLDTDGDGIPDVLESSLQTDTNLPDSDGDGINDGDEINRGTDPKDFYNGAAHYVQVTSGDIQSITQGQETPAAIAFKVRSADGLPIANAPVKLSVLTGGGEIRLDTSGSAGTTNLSTNTDTNGEVKVRFKSTE